MTSLIEAPGLASNHALVIERIIRAALDAADPQRAVERALHMDGETLAVGEFTCSLRDVRRVRIAAIGKAAQAMARGAVAVLGGRVTDGLVITKHLEAGNGGLPERVQVLAGSHPVPGAGSVASARRLEEFLRGSLETDLVLCLISGGGSALAALPQEGVELEDLQALTRQLLASGAAIGEINTLRKHLDRVKGGGLARMAAPARIASLILSDVIGSPLDSIASGPTVADSSTYAGALAILETYGLASSAPGRILEVLQRGAQGLLPETLKNGDPVLERVHNRVIASNLQAAQAALDQAQAEGMQSMLLTTFLQGEASQAGTALAAVIKEIAATGHPLARPSCIAAGGETTVTLRGNGRGGRNQEMALSAAFLLDGAPGVALVAFGTDGEDGPTDAGGAVVTGETLAQARLVGVDALAALRGNDSYGFFSRVGGLVKTGPTGTNVNDLALLFAF